MEVQDLLPKLNTLLTVKMNQVWMLLDRGYIIEKEELALFSAATMKRKGYSFSEVEFAAMTGNRSAYLQYILERKLPLVMKGLKGKNENGRDYRLALSQYYKSPEGKKMLVKYTPGGEDLQGSGYRIQPAGKRKTSLAVATVASFINEFDSGGYDEAILISDLPLTNEAMSRISDVTQEKNEERKQKRHVWVFVDNELRINPNNHQLAVPHTALSEDEKKQFLIGARCKADQLPRMDFNEPIGKWFGWERDVVVKIRRNNLSVDNMIAPESLFYRLIK